MLVGTDAGQVHGVYLAGEIIEGQADKRRRRATEELMYRAAQRGLVLRSIRR